MLRAPEPLREDHALADFQSGEGVLDEWLQRRALKNPRSGASRSFVVTDGPVIAYYALAAGAIVTQQAPGRFRRNMPDPILARLAVTRSYQGRGLGRALFQDAVRRVLHAADAIGIRGMLVHALNENARNFYLSLGMTPSPMDPMMLMATIEELDASGA